jgi:predicted Zn finger-like uncharacterized protein
VISIKRIVGALLLVFGVVTGGYAATMDMPDGSRRADTTPGDRLAIGIAGALGGAVFAVPGLILVLSGDKPSESKSGGRKPEPDDESGPIRFPCPECATWLRAARDKVGGEVRCPKCEQRARVPARSVPRPPPSAQPDTPEQPEAEPDAPPTGAAGLPGT